MRSNLPFLWNVVISFSKKNSVLYVHTVFQRKNSTSVDVHAETVLENLCFCVVFVGGVKVNTFAKTKFFSPFSCKNALV